MKNIKQIPFEPDDLSILYEWLQNENVFKNLYILYHPMTMDDLQEWYNKEKKNNAHIFKFFKGSKIIIGIGLVHYIHTKNRCAEISIQVDPKYTGKGYGQFIFKSLIKYSFNILNLHKIFFHTVSSNNSIIAFADKYQFTLEGTYRKELFYADTYFDIYRYGMLDDEYRKNNLLSE